MNDAHCCHSNPSQKGPAATVRDPICEMEVDPNDSAGMAEFEGVTYSFCSEYCLRKFQASPARYVHGNSRRAPAPTDAGAIHTCPMHPDVKQAGPGSCPFCGMALEPLEVSLEDEGPNPELLDFGRRLSWALAFCAPLLILAMGEMVPGSPLHHWLPGNRMNVLQLLFSAPVVFWAGAPLLQKGWVSLKSRNLNMFTLISLGTLVAFVFSALATVAPSLFPAAFRSHGERVDVYFEAAAVIVTLVLLGQVLELKARRQTNLAIRALLKLAPSTARVVREDGREQDIDLRDVHPGDRIRVRPGEQVPVDGVVLSGRGTLDESMLSGEPIPVEKIENDAVTAGTTNLQGSFILETKSAGADTLLGQIVRSVNEAQRTRAPIQSLADQVSKWFVPAVVLAAIVTALAWSAFGPEPALLYALVNAVAVLIIACPCALGLATPMSIMVGMGRGAQAGVLVRDAEALERLEKVDTLVFDKTGTLTEGRPKLVTIAALPGFDDASILRAAATVEKGSEHPLARSVLEAAHDRGFSALPETDGFESYTGMGVSGRVGGHAVLLGNLKLLESAAVPTEALASRASALRREGQTVLFIAIDQRPAGMLGIADPIKATALDALRTLRDEGLRLVMLTGDHAVTARAVAEKLGLEEVHADVLPDEKRAVIQKLQAEGRRVAMAGDGVNDAPALAQAEVGIAMGTGTDVAIQSASITLVKGDLRGVVRARRLSRKTMRNIRQNLFFAFAYNALGVPLAAGALYPLFGLLLSPMVASAAMSLSSVSVIGNALRLRNAKIG